MSNAYKNVTSDVITTNNFTLQGYNGTTNYSIVHNGSYAIWDRLNKSAVFLDSTDNTQDLGTSQISVNFDTILFDNIGISYGGNNFVFNEAGTYMINFECLLSNSAAQTMLSFRLDFNVIYSNLSNYNPSYNVSVPFYSSFIINTNPGSILEILSDPYIANNNYLLRNPIYGIPITKLEIIKI